MRRRRASLLLFFAAAAGCARDEASPPDLFDSLTALCGQAFAGALVSNDPQDADFADAAMVMHVRDCDAGAIRIPFHVGDDRSRTWVLTRTDAGLRLKHDHRHEDGTEDEITQYGGDSRSVSALRAEFPADDYSKALFERTGLTASVGNVWAIELTPTMFAYELKRENRFFRVEFDVTEPVPAPPPPWGAAPP